MAAIGTVTDPLVVAVCVLVSAGMVLGENPGLRLDRAAGWLWLRSGGGLPRPAGGRGPLSRRHGD